MKKQMSSAKAPKVLGPYSAGVATEGLTYDDVVKTTVLLDDMNDFAKVNEEYAKHFTEPFPARSCFEVAKLPKNAKVEIECIAIKK